MKFVAQTILVMAILILANILSAFEPELTKTVFCLAGYFTCTVFYYKKIFRS